MYKLLGSFLKLNYDFLGSYALAIIVFTVIIKLLLLPLTFSQTRSMKAMQDLQPKMDEIKKKYKDDPEKQNQKILELYKENKVNPVAGCLPLLIQLPIIFALIAIIRNPDVYVFASQAAYQAADTGFLWVKSLSQPDIIKVGNFNVPYILPVLACVTQYFQTKMTLPASTTGKADPNRMMMLYLFPAMMLLWGQSFPSGLMLYWVTGTIFQIVQQFIQYKGKTPASAIALPESAGPSVRAPKKKGK